MYNNHRPSHADLPSAARLIKSTVVAIALAAVVLVTAVLPAEYGIDPTGVGNVLGLTKMGEIKASLAEEVAAESASEQEMKPEAGKVVEPVAKPEKPAVTQSEKPVKSDSITVSLKPNQGREVKVRMAKGSKVSYQWKTSNGRANFDVHGDSTKHQINYFNYSKGSAESSDGVLEAEFEGKHGWFWRNRTGQSMTITLEVEGEFTEMIQEV
ncbi:MAG: hypothetical protein R6V08_12100 [Desulfuromonadales bacterium]